MFNINIIPKNTQAPVRIISGAYCKRKILKTLHSIVGRNIQAWLACALSGLVNLLLSTPRVSVYKVSNVRNKSAKVVMETTQTLRTISDSNCHKQSKVPGILDAIVANKVTVTWSFLMQCHLYFKIKVNVLLDSESH